MINIPPIKQSSNIKAEVIPELTRAWKVGQVLNATTERGGDALSNVLIRVGQQTLQAKAPVALQPGQELKLLVKSLQEFQGNNGVSRLPLLTIIEVKPVPPETGELIAIKLRQFIAVQQSFSQLQLSATRLINNPLSATQLNPAFKNLVNNLQQSVQLSSPAHINPAQLKQQLANSGIFFESKLLNLSVEKNRNANVTSTLSQDFKLQLLSIKTELAKQLPQTQQSRSQTLNNQQLQTLQLIIEPSVDSPGENKINILADKLVSILPAASLAQLSKLLGGQKPDSTTAPDIISLAKLLNTGLQQGNQQQTPQLLVQLEYRLQLLDLSLQIDQSINKITSLQLQPLLQPAGKDPDNLVLLLFNLVFKDAHEHFDIHFRIQQDDTKQDPDKESWTVTLEFNFKTLGKVQSKIQLTGNQVSSVFYTELAATAEKIKSLLSLLEASLSKAGLIINNLAVENKPLDNRSIIYPQINILDEKA